MGQPKARYRLPHGHGSFYQRADGMWIGAFSDGWTATGSRRRIVVKSRDENRAWDALMAAKKKVATGESTRQSPTFKAWSDQWLASAATRLRPSSHRGESSYVSRWLVPLLGSKRLDKITPADVRSLQQVMRDAGRSSTTIGKVQGALQKILKDAKIEGHRIHEGVLLARKPAPAVSDRDAVPLPDALRLVAHAATKPDASRWVAALLQGMRQGECLGLTWECVDLEARAIDVSWQLETLTYEERAKGTFVYPDGFEHRQLVGTYHLTRPKTRTSVRRIPLVPWMHDALVAWREIAPSNRWGLVWPNATGTMPRNEASDLAAWKRLCAEAGVAKEGGAAFVGHEARHTAASLLLAAGVDPKIVQQIMGHTKLAMTQQYMHASPEMVRTALQSAATLLQLTAADEG